MPENTVESSTIHTVRVKRAYVLEGEDIIVSQSYTTENSTSTALALMASHFDIGENIGLRKKTCQTRPVLFPALAPHPIAKIYA